MNAVWNDILPHASCPAANAKSSKTRDHSKTQPLSKELEESINQETTVGSKIKYSNKLNEKATIKELDFESTKTLVASIIDAQLNQSSVPSLAKPAEKKIVHNQLDHDEIPCKDVETLYQSTTFVESSDLEELTRPTQVLRYTGRVQPNPQKRHLPVLPLNAFRWPPFGKSLPSQPGLTEMCLIAIGGLASEGGRQPVHRFSPSTNQWQVVSAMPDSRQNHSTVVLQHMVYVAGGMDIKQSVSICICLILPHISMI